MPLPNGFKGISSCCRWNDSPIVEFNLLMAGALTLVLHGCNCMIAFQFLFTAVVATPTANSFMF